MKQSLAICVITIIFLLPLTALAIPDHIEYNINIHTDGSARWRIIHVTDLESQVADWEDYEKKLHSMIESSKNSANRDMALDLASLEIRSDIQWESASKNIQYSFTWKNFSVTNKDQICFGDVFTDNFFSLLIGDGELYITYPENFALTLVAPFPNEHNNSSRTLHWYRTKDFLTAYSSVQLTKQNMTINQEIPITIISIISSTAIGATCLTIFIYRRKRKEKPSLTRLSIPQEPNNSEEKILQLLKASGGGIKQSEICSKLKFSRAKTSILLAEMEKKNKVKRQKKGKNKIVFKVD